MSIPQLTTDLNIIQTLADEPNDTTGLTSTELKAKFDVAGNLIKTYINDFLIPGSDTSNSALQSQIDSNDGDITTLQGRVTTSETNITGLGTSKANVTDVYTKAQIDTNQATKAEVQQITLGQIADGSISDIKFSNAAGQIKSVVNDYSRVPAYGVTTGSANTYVVTLATSPIGYTDGLGVIVKINVDSTGASTLNINNLGAIALTNSVGVNVTNFKTNGIYSFRYNSSTLNFQLQGEGVDATSLITATNLILGM